MPDNTYTAVQAVHDISLDGTGNALVTLTGPHKRVRIFNWHNTEKMYYRLDGVDAVVGADETMVIPPDSNVLCDVVDIGNVSVSMVGLDNVFSVVGESH